MPSPERRAVVFDLDDTLYPYRWHVRSGFAAVAAHMARTRGLNARRVFRVLLRASRGPDRGRELQVCLETFRLPYGVLPGLVEVMRGHHPRLRLPATAQRLLAALRADGWRIGILTNGPAPIQARKIAALGLVRLVDTVVYATQYGTGIGKPDAAAFTEMARRLDTPAHRIVVVGNDDECDVAGARAAGMLAARCDVWTPARSVPDGEVVIDRLARVPHVVHALVEEARNRHAA